MRSSATAVGGLLIVAVLSAGRVATAVVQDVRLVEAAAQQDRETIRALLKQNVAVDSARADGVTALLWAAHWNDLELVEALLGAGADANAADDHGVTALARACENASEPVVAALLKAGAAVNTTQRNGLTPLMIAARTGSLTVVNTLLAHGADPNRVTGEANASALMWALAQGHPAIVRTLIERGADVKVSTTKGLTPLMFAARQGDIELGRLLIAAGADVNATGADGTHVLPYAITNGQDRFALFLLEQGADPNARISGIPSLHAATGAVGVWLSDWNRRHGVGGSLAFLGGGGGSNIPPDRRLVLVRALLARGADPNARVAASAMFMGYIGYPTRGAFEPFATGTGNLDGATPLWVAAYTANGNVGGGGDGGRGAEAMNPGDATGEILKVLLAAKADPQLATADGTTPLMVAAGLGRATFQPGLQRGRRSPTAEQAVTILLDAGVDVNAVNEADFTALHGAAIRGLNEVIQILVDRGADINARDFRGRTAFRIAEGAKQSFQFQAYPETAEFLRKIGANTRLGVPGTVQERARDLAAEAAAARAVAGQQQ